MKKYQFSDEQIALMRNAVLEMPDCESVTLQDAREFFSEFDDSVIVEWAGHDKKLPHPSAEELLGQFAKLIETFGPDAKPNLLLYDALAPKAKYCDPWELLKEFVQDLHAVHGTGFAQELDEQELDWPDLAITYQKAVEALAWCERAKGDAKDPIAITRWISSGEIGEHPDFRSLLETAGRMLDKSGATDLFGDVVFESEDGTVHVLSAEGLIAQANPAYVADLEERLDEYKVKEEDDDASQ